MLSSSSIPNHSSTLTLSCPATSQTRNIMVYGAICTTSLMNVAKKHRHISSRALNYKYRKIQTLLLLTIFVDSFLIASKPSKMIVTYIFLVSCNQKTFLPTLSKSKLYRGTKQDVFSFSSFHLCPNYYPFWVPAVPEEKSPRTSIAKASI